MLTAHASVSCSVSSHGSHRFTLIILGSSCFSTLHHDNCLNPISPHSYVCALQEPLPWKLVTTDGPDTSRLAYTIGKICTHTQRCMHTHALFAHSLICKALWDVAYYYDCTDVQTEKNHKETLYVKVCS